MTPMRSTDKEARWKERGRVTCAQRLVQRPVFSRPLRVCSIDKPVVVLKCQRS